MFSILLSILVIPTQLNFSTYPVHSPAHNKVLGKAPIQGYSITCFDITHSIAPLSGSGKKTF